MPLVEVLRKVYDLYKANKNDSARFILGKNGDRKLFVVGLNPSTANKEKSDTTVSKVEKVAQHHGYDGFVMTNLYPLRSTNPEGLPEQPQHSLLDSNTESIIRMACLDKKPVFWAAWGVNIVLRPYLLESLIHLNMKVNTLGGEWIHYGGLSKAGHPRHPSRLCYDWEFSQFGVDVYIQKLHA